MIKKTTFKSRYTAFIALICLLVFSSIPLQFVYVHASTSTNDFAGGQGTQSDPYQIATAEQLDHVRDYLNAHFELIANIDLSSYDNWNAIGDNTNPFNGTFNGNGFSISNLKITGSTEMKFSQGLFGYTDISSKIYNVTLVNVNINAPNYYYVGALVGVNKGSIEKSVATGVVKSQVYVGGLVGRNMNGTVKDSISKVDVEGAAYNVGGLIGSNNYGVVQNSFATGNVTSVTANSYNIGGLVGYNENSSIENSFATGNVTGTYYIGGLAGIIKGVQSNISNSYATGNVTGTQGTLGGLAGSCSSINVTNSYATGDVTGSGDKSGGLIGYSDTCSVTNSYATGNVNVNGKNIGGLVGVIQEAELTNSYAKGNITGNQNVGGLVGRMSADGKVKNSFALGSIIDGTDTNGIGRIVGAFHIDRYELSNNYALSGMLVNHQTIDDSKKDLNGINGVDITEENAKNASSYSEWDFTNTWKMEGNTYPTLRTTERIGFQKYDVTVQKSPSDVGTITGTGQYEPGEEVELKATVNNHYSVKWFVNGHVISEQQKVEFYMPVMPITIDVSFERDNKYEVTAQPNDSKGGSVTGSGTYEYGSQVTLKATPSDGYRFVGWMENGKLISVDFEYTYTVTNENRTIVAKFEKIQQNTEKITPEKDTKSKSNENKSDEGVKDKSKENTSVVENKDDHSEIESLSDDKENKSKEDSSSKLPKTATNFAYWLLIGLGFILIGIFGLAFKKRKV